MNTREKTFLGIFFFSLSVAGGLLIACLIVFQSPIVSLGITSTALVLAVVGAGPQILLFALSINVLLGSARIFQDPFINLNRVLGVLLLLSIAHQFGAKKKRIRFDSLTLTVMLYFFIVLLSTAFSPDGSRSADFLRLYVRAVLLFFFIGSVIDNEEWLRRYIHVILATGVVAVFTSLYTLMVNPQSARAVGLFGFTTDPNFFGCLLVCLLPLAMFCIEESRELERKLYYIAVSFLFLYGIMLTFSRGAFIGLIAVIVYLAISKKISRKSVAAFLPLLLLAFALVPMQYWRRMATIITFFGSGHATITTDLENIVRRFDYLKAGVGIFSDFPILGIGVENFPLFYPAYAPPGADISMRSPHNLYLQLLVETGVLGFAAMGAVFLVAFRFLRIAQGNHRASYASRMAVFLRGSLIGYLAASLFISTVIYEIFWIIIGLAYVLKNLAEEPQRGIAATENRKDSWKSIDTNHANHE